MFFMNTSAAKCRDEVSRNTKRTQWGFGRIGKIGAHIAVRNTGFIDSVLVRLWAIGFRLQSRRQNELPVRSTVRATNQGLMGLLEFFIIAGLVFVNGFFVAAEFALVKVRTSQIDQLVVEGNWAAKLTSRALDHLDAYLSASQVGITVTSLALGWAIEGWVIPGVRAVLSAIGGKGWGSGETVTHGLSLGVVPILSFGLVTFLHVALGEQAPKSLAIRSAKTIALWTAPPLMAIYYTFWPLIWLLNNASNLTLRVLGLGKTDHVELAHSEEELRLIVAESVAGGHLSRSERVMIENVLNLEEKTARRVMVPRPDIVYLSLSRSVEDNLRVARQAGHTRYPLCEEDLTTVVGMVHVKDLFRAGTRRAAVSIFGNGFGRCRSCPSR